jgi:hypothetical protein
MRLTAAADVSTGQGLPKPWGEDPDVFQRVLSVENFGAMDKTISPGSRSIRSRRRLLPQLKRKPHMNPTGEGEGRAAYVCTSPCDMRRSFDGLHAL